jgi:hypothetical protein
LVPSHEYASGHGVEKLKKMRRTTTKRSQAAESDTSAGGRSDRLKDEVYRQMFRLEANRPGADLGLALALLRAWLDSNGKPAERESREWLRKICPICVAMIEASLRSEKSVRQGAE